MIQLRDRRSARLRCGAASSVGGQIEFAGSAGMLVRCLMAMSHSFFAQVLADFAHHLEERRRLCSIAPVIRPGSLLHVGVLRKDSSTASGAQFPAAVGLQVGPAPTSMISNRVSRAAWCSSGSNRARNAARVEQVF